MDRHYVRVRDTPTFYLVEPGELPRPVHNAAEMYQIGLLPVRVVSAVELEAMLDPVPDPEPDPEDENGE